jgi:hypothetical protein
MAVATTGRGRTVRPRTTPDLRSMRWDEVLSRLPDGPVTVAEVGVWKGSLSKRLLEERPQIRLWLIDPWLAGSPGTSWWESSSRMPRLPQSEYEKSYDRVRMITERHPGRAVIMRVPSVEAAQWIADASLDMAFLDADHSEAGLLADIDAWAPKVRPGGWICGHDYGAERFPGVARAVRCRYEDSAVEVGGDDTWFVRL